MDWNDLEFLIGGALGGFLVGLLHCRSRRKAYREGVRDAHKQIEDAKAARELLRRREDSDQENA